MGMPPYTGCQRVVLLELTTEPGILQVLMSLRVAQRIFQEFSAITCPNKNPVSRTFCP